MGQYKVPQNVESEDKIIGPLTFKQFVYAMIGFAWGAVSFAVFRNIPVVMIIIGGPPAILLMLLAFYSRDGQNFEQLLIALVGFFGNSRKRVWRKEEITASFHIVPRKIVVEQSQRDPVAVRSELDRLATMIDSRGWNSAGVGSMDNTPPTSDRLITPTAPVTPQTLAEPAASEDMLDLQHSPLAQNLAGLIEEAATDVREEAIEQMKERQTAATRKAPAATPAQSISGVTTTNPDDILKLATERDDLTVSQLAATATRTAAMQEGQSVDVRT